MLGFYPKRMLALREIEKPHSTLVKAGISPATATNLLKYYNKRITLDHVEKICVLLYCTPNDLFYWKPDPKAPLPEHHPLYALQRKEKIANIREMIKEMPVEKLSELETVIEGLKNR